MTDNTSPRTVRRPNRPNGPHLGLLAVIAFALTLAGVIALAALSGGAAVPSPFGDPAATIARFSHDQVAVRVGAVLQFGAAVPLGIFTATAYARQLRLGIRVPGPVIGLYGGVTASILLMLSALVSWTLSRPETLAQPAAVPALAVLAFALGGVGFAVGMGLLIAGIAVPALILRLLPRWLAIVGLAIAGAAEVSFLSLAFDPLQTLLPIARFGGGAWLIVAGFLLPKTRARANEPQAQDEGAAS